MNDEIKGQNIKNIKQKIWDFYYNNYKLLLIIPFLMLFLALAYLGYFAATTGEIIRKDVSLKGGVTLTIPLEKEIDIHNLQTSLSSKFPQNDITIRVLGGIGQPAGIIVEADIKPEKEEISLLVKAIETDLGIDLSRAEYGEETVGSSLGANFFKESTKAVFIAFLFMGLVVFLYFGSNVFLKILSFISTLIAMFLIFSLKNTLGDILAYLVSAALIFIYMRSSIPSIAVILAAFSDMAVTLAVINILGIKIGTAGIAAFLMLIGYSVDTDILLTVRVLKRKEGTLSERIASSIKTGVTMTITAIIAVSITLLITQSEVIRQIMVILLIGLMADLINTWIQNVGLLRWYLEKKEKNKL